MRLQLATLIISFASLGIMRAQAPAELYDRNWILQSVEHVGSLVEMPVPGNEPSMRFLRDTCRGCGPDEFALSAHDGCNGNFASYRVWSTDSLHMGSGAQTLLYCGNGIIEFAQYYQMWYSRTQFYRVTDSALTLWNRDSSIALHFGLTPPAQFGSRVQIVNLTTRFRGIDLFGSDSSRVVLSVDSGARVSRAVWLAQSTVRLALSPRDSGYSHHVYDTTLEASDTTHLVLIAYEDAAGNAHAMALQRQIVASGPNTRVRVAHASADAGTLLVRVESDGPRLVLEDHHLTEGTTTDTSTVASSPLRLFVLREGDTTINRFASSVPEQTDATTLIITGDPESGNLAAYVFSDSPLHRVGSIARMATSGSAGARRIVNMIRDRSLTFATPHIETQNVPALSASTIDADMRLNDSVVIGYGDHSYAFVHGAHQQSLQTTIVGPGERAFDARSSLTDLPSIDSTMLAIAMVGLDAELELRIGGDVIPSSLRPYRVQYYVRLAGLCTLAVYMPRTGAGDSLLAAFDGVFAGGRTYTVVFDFQIGDVTARVVDNGVFAAQPVLRMMRRIAIPPDESLRTGSLAIVNTTNWTMQTDVLNLPDPTIGAHRAKRVASREPVSYTGTFIMTGDGPAQTIESPISIAPDSATHVFMLGGEWSQPWTVLSLSSSDARAAHDTMPRIRIINALASIDRVDVVSSDLSGLASRVRLHRYEATEHHASIRTNIRVGVFNISGAELFIFTGGLRSGLSYTAILTGTTTEPRAYLFDEGVDDQALAPMSIEAATAGLTSRASESAFVMGIHPNPASREITISATGNVDEINILDVLGTIVRTIAVNSGSTNIPLDGLPSGIYRVVAHTPGGARCGASFVIAR